MTDRYHFDAITRIYDERRTANRHIQNERYREVCQAIPGFEDIKTSIADISGSQLNSIISGSHDAVINTRALIRQAEEKRKQLLLEHGYPENYLDRIYTCPDCKDTGFIGSKRCHCFKKELLNMLYDQSNLKQITESDNFSNFNIEYYPDDYICTANDMTPRDNIKKVLNICRMFIENFDDSYENLLIYGPTGVGKTFLSHCIAKELLDRDKSVIYLTSYQLFDILETKVFHQEELDNITSGILSMLHTCDLLIIDDLGTEMINKFTETQLFTCIQQRITGRLSTIISTNLSFDDINSNYSERIFSRLTGYYRLVKITGDDIRILKALSD